MWSLGACCPLSLLLGNNGPGKKLIFVVHAYPNLNDDVLFGLLIEHKLVIPRAEPNGWPPQQASNLGTRGL